MDFEKIVITIISGILTWLSLSHIQQGKKIATIQTMTTGFSDSIKTLSIAVDNLSKKVEDSTLKLSNRIDLFLKSEIDTLKEIANNTKPNHK